MSMIFEELISDTYAQTEFMPNGMVIAYVRSRLLEPSVLFYYKNETIAKVVVNHDSMFVKLSEVIPTAEQRIERDTGYAFEQHECCFAGLDEKRLIKIFQIIKHHVSNEFK